MATGGERGMIEQLASGIGPMASTSPLSAPLFVHRLGHAKVGRCRWGAGVQFNRGRDLPEGVVDGVGRLDSDVRRAPDEGSLRPGESKRTRASGDSARSTAQTPLRRFVD